jgi:hypothetical protein
MTLRSTVLIFAAMRTQILELCIWRNTDILVDIVKIAFYEVLEFSYAVHPRNGTWITGISVRIFVCISSQNGTWITEIAVTNIWCNSNIILLKNAVLNKGSNRRRTEIQWVEVNISIFLSQVAYHISILKKKGGKWKLWGCEQFHSSVISCL